MWSNALVGLQPSGEGWLPASRGVVWQTVKALAQPFSADGSGQSYAERAYRPGLTRDQVATAMDWSLSKVIGSRLGLSVSLQTTSRRY